MLNRYWIVFLVATVVASGFAFGWQHNTLQEVRVESAKYQLAVEALNGQAVQNLNERVAMQAEFFELLPHSHAKPPTKRLRLSCENSIAPPSDPNPVPTEPLRRDEAEVMYKRANTVLLYNLQPTGHGKSVEQFDDYPGMKIAEAVYIQNRLREEEYYDLADALEEPLTACFSLGVKIGAIDMWEMRDVHNAKLNSPN